MIFSPRKASSGKTGFVRIPWGINIKPGSHGYHAFLMHLLFQLMSCAMAAASCVPSRGSCAEELSSQLPQKKTCECGGTGVCSTLLSLLQPYSVMRRACVGLGCSQSPSVGLGQHTGLQPLDQNLRDLGCSSSTVSGWASSQITHHSQFLLFKERGLFFLSPLCPEYFIVAALLHLLSGNRLSTFLAVKLNCHFDSLSPFFRVSREPKWL